MRKTLGARVNSSVLITGLAVLLAAAGNATAGTITVTWSGTVFSTGIAGTIDVGDTITGSFAYDDSASVATSGFDYAIYGTSHVSSFSVNGLSGSRTNNAIGVWNDVTGLVDQFDTRNHGTPGVYSGDLLGGFAPIQIFVRFNDSTGTALASTALPSFLDPADFDFLMASRLDFAAGGPSAVAFFVDTFSFSSTPIPEPATLLLLGTGLAAAGIRRRMKKAE